MASIAYYVGRRPLKMDDGMRMPGAPIPEAARWKNLRSYLRTGAVVERAPEHAVTREDLFALLSPNQLRALGAKHGVESEKPAEIAAALVSLEKPHADPKKKPDAKDVAEALAVISSRPGVIPNRIETPDGPILSGKKTKSVDAE